MIAMAERSLEVGDKVALLQVVINHLAVGESMPQHRHGCAMVCLSLGAARDFIVDDRAIWMKHGSAVLVNAGSAYGVPTVKGVQTPQVLVSLLFGSGKDYGDGSL